MTEERKRCNAVVHRRDTYRYTGRGKSGFEMHYNRTQCRRLAMPDHEFCRQHRELLAHYGESFVARWDR